MSGEIFGPVQSRRLGLSLGVNHLPEKTCTYSCIYCQLGRTRRMSAERKDYGDPDQLRRLTGERLKALAGSGQLPDTITLVPNGEPTLDRNLAAIIRGLKSFHIPIAVITNASLLSDLSVREDLREAGIVSVKIDTVLESTWKKINRPHGSLELAEILKGIEQFADAFSGKLITESMLAAGINDSRPEASAVGEFIKNIRPAKAYLALPLRPPAEAQCHAPDGRTTLEYLRALVERGVPADLLGGLPETHLNQIVDIQEGLIKVLKVHPLSEKEILDFLERSGHAADLLDELVDKKTLIKQKISGQHFYAYDHQNQ